jgi:DNA repair ATPase RecN
MSKRDAFIASLKAQLDEWSEDLRKLEARVGKAETGVADKYRHAIAELHEKRAAAEAKLEALRHSSEETWEDHKDDAERIWTAFKAGLDVLRDFSDHA